MVNDSTTPEHVPGDPPAQLRYTTPAMRSCLVAHGVADAPDTSIAIGDPAMFNYPLSYMTEAGYLTVTDIEAKALHDYLLKGGFIIFDDFRPDIQRGNDGWRNFVDVMRRVMPEGKLMLVDSRNPIFHSFFDIGTLEFHQAYDVGKPGFYGMFEHDDPTRPLQMIANPLAVRVTRYPAVLQAAPARHSARKNPGLSDGNIGMLNVRSTG